MSDSVSFVTANKHTQQITEQLKRHPKRIVFTDGEDERVIRVARKLVDMEAIAPILLGNKERIQALAAQINVSLKFINVIQPDQTSDLELFCRRLTKVERFRGRTVVDPEDMVVQPHNFAAMMVQYNQVDGIVAGNASQPWTVFRALKNFIKPQKDVESLSGVIVTVAPHLQHMGRDGILFLADCALIPEPTVDELAHIAVETGRLAHHFLGRTPRIALLSHSTHGNNSSPSSKRVAAATSMAKAYCEREMLDFDIDGELTADVALDMAAADTKLADSRAEHPADVLVFPSLDAAHISYKLLRHVGGAQHYGQLILGLTRPVAKVSLTVTEETLLGTALLVGAEAIKYRELFPGGDSDL